MISRPRPLRTCPPVRAAANAAPRANSVSGAAGCADRKILGGAGRGAGEPGAGRCDAASAAFRRGGLLDRG
eukprot:COSAG04_NODE_1036_length_8609_cov_33.941716_6_plen_71_part_00